MRSSSHRWLGLFLGTFAILAACGSEDTRGSASDRDAGAGPDAAAMLDATSVPDGSEPLLPDGAPAPWVRVTRETLDVNGKSHVFLLGVPTTLDPAKSYPVVMSFHGTPAVAEVQLAAQPFERVSRGEAILVYPQAYSPNDQDPTSYDWDIFSKEPNNVDIAFVRAIPDALVAKGLRIDRSRIFGYGLSGGAFFVQVMVCLANDFFRAVGANAGGAPTELALPKFGDGCPKCPGGPTPTIIVHGGLDDVVGPASGPYAAQCQAESTGCGTSMTDTTPTPCKLYDGCPAGKPLELCFVPEANHNPGWPLALETTWSFFQSAP